MPDQTTLHGRTPPPPRVLRRLQMIHVRYRALELDSYFCDPHSPWQKGGVENANGRVRRHLPLACPAEARAQPALAEVARRLNATPRRCLGYRTPAEVFTANLAALAGPVAPVGPQA